MAGLRIDRRMLAGPLTDTSRSAMPAVEDGADVVREPREISLVLPTAAALGVFPCRTGRGRVATSRHLT